MIFYGTRATSLGEENINETCPSCGTPNSVHMAVFQKYAHVYWIPFFPIGKTGASVCTHCKQSLELKQMPPAFKEKYERIKAHKSAPVWTFSGLGIIAVLIVIGIISSRITDGKVAKLVKEPKAGDVYELLIGSKYSLMKVMEVSGDSVWVAESNYEAEYSSGLSKIKEKEDAFSDDEVLYTKARLAEMAKDGDIQDIERK